MASPLRGLLPIEYHQGVHLVTDKELADCLDIITRNSGRDWIFGYLDARAWVARIEGNTLYLRPNDPRYSITFIGQLTAQENGTWIDGQLRDTRYTRMAAFSSCMLAMLILMFGTLLVLGIGEAVNIVTTGGDLISVLGRYLAGFGSLALFLLWMRMIELSHRYGKEQDADYLLDRMYKLLHAHSVPGDSQTE
jgi:hypothetical protein